MCYRFAVLIFITICNVLFCQLPIAVLDFEAEGISGSEARILTDRFRFELLRTGLYKVIEREMIDEIIYEQGLQQSGCVSTECIVEVGRVIGVHQIITGSIGRIEDIYTISARIIDVETGQIIKSSVYDFRGSKSGLLKSGMRIVVLKITNLQSNDNYYLNNVDVKALSLLLSIKYGHTNGEPIGDYNIFGGNVGILLKSGVFIKLDTEMEQDGHFGHTFLVFGYEYHNLILLTGLGNFWFYEDNENYGTVPPFEAYGARFGIGYKFTISNHIILYPMLKTNLGQTKGKGSDYYPNMISDINIALNLGLKI